MRSGGLGDGLSMKQFYLVLTTGCPNHCINCCVPHELLAERATISLPEIREIMASYEIGAGDVLEITGGEPTSSRTELIETLRYLVEEKGFEREFVNLLSHASPLADEAYAQQVARWVGHLSSTFYSIDEHAHDFMAQHIGAWAAKRRALDNMAAAGVQLHIKFLLTKLNYRTCEAFVAFCAEHYPQAILVFALLDYSGEAWNNKALINVRMRAVRPHLEAAIDLARQRGMRVNVLFPMCLIDPSRWESVISRDWATTSLKKQVFIEPDLEAGTQVVEVSELDWPDIRFREKPELCEGCALFDRCVWERGGYAEMYRLEDELTPFRMQGVNA
jgi:MoaA/NifB/PqqE/SkfB family radical SAM enzyme